MAEKIYKGKNLRIFVDEKSILHSTECNFSTTRNFEGIATKDTNGNINTPGNYEWNLSANALFADKDVANTAQTDFFNVLQKFKNATRVFVQFTTNEGGDAIISGYAYISSANIAAATEGSATGDFAFQGDGDFELDRMPSAPVFSSPDSTHVYPITEGDEGTIDLNGRLASSSGAVTTWAFSGTLITGITLNTSTGIITYTDEINVTELIEITGVVTATNADGSATKNITIQVAPL